MDDFEGWKGEAELQIARARRYAGYNGEFWIQIFRAVRGANTEWVRLGRVPGETLHPFSAQALINNIAPDFNPPTRGGSPVASSASSPYQDSGSTMTDATNIDSIPSSDLDYRVRKRRRWKRQRQADAAAVQQAIARQSTAIQQAVNRAPRPRSNSITSAGSLQPSPPDEERLSIQEPPRKTRGRKPKAPLRQQTAAPSKIQKTRKSTPKRKTQPGPNHRPVTRSQAKAAKAK